MTLIKPCAMKKKFFLPVFICTLVISQGTTFAQCIPDTINCKDTLLPGEICPRVLPDGYEGQEYSEVITVIPPTEAEVGGVLVEVVKIVVTAVSNLPPGLTYEMNAAEFYKDTTYCILLSGTPESPGTFDLEITVVPYVYIALFNSVVESDPVVDDSSLTMTIQPAIGHDGISEADLLVTCGPNPFNHTTLISINSRNHETAELKVYNLLGKLVYQENKEMPPGRNSFDFNGMNINSGAYIYTVSTASKLVTGRIVKIKD
jgi:hypothetical protein